MVSNWNSLMSHYSRKKSRKQSIASTLTRVWKESSLWTQRVSQSEARCLRTILLNTDHWSLNSPQRHRPLSSLCIPRMTSSSSASAARNTRSWLPLKKSTLWSFFKTLAMTIHSTEKCSVYECDKYIRPTWLNNNRLIKYHSIIKVVCLLQHASLSLSNG